jgi:hypothetical protein
VWTIAVAGHRVYAGGTSFTLPDGRTANGVVAWNGEAWSDLSGGLGSGGYAGPVMAIAAAGERILAGGDLFSLPPASGAAAGPAPAR